jgi:hypothetical protein
MADGARALRIGLHAVDQVAPRLFHLAEELRVRMLRLQIRAGADVIRARHPEHVEQAGHEHVEAEQGEPVRVDLVVGGDPVGVVHHEDAGPASRPFRMRHVAGMPSSSWVSMRATVMSALLSWRLHSIGTEGNGAKPHAGGVEHRVAEGGGHRVDAASPTPRGGWSRRWINSNSSLGTSGKVRIG